MSNSVLLWPALWVPLQRVAQLAGDDLLLLVGIFLMEIRVTRYHVI